MNILLDLDETLICESDARNRAALDFLAQFSNLPFSEPEFTKLWHDLAERHVTRYNAGEITFQEHRRCRLRELFSPYESPISDSELDGRFEFYLARYESNWTLFDDVIPFLERARGSKLGIVTNGDSKQQRDKLTRTKILKYFEVVVISSEVGAAKPQSKIFLEACHRLSAEPRECIFIGDRIDLDVQGSEAAGMTPIWINRASETTGSHAFKTVTNLSQVDF
jgi:putative hydrolase of the HAD superfamily